MVAKIKTLRNKRGLHATRDAASEYRRNFTFAPKRESSTAKGEVFPGEKAA